MLFFTTAPSKEVLWSCQKCIFGFKVEHIFFSSTIPFRKPWNDWRIIAVSTVSTCHIHNDRQPCFWNRVGKGQLIWINLGVKKQFPTTRPDEFITRGEFYVQVLLICRSFSINIFFPPVMVSSAVHSVKNHVDCYWLWQGSAGFNLNVEMFLCLELHNTFNLIYCKQHEMLA